MVTKEKLIVLHKVLYNLFEDYSASEVLRQVLFQQNDFNIYITFHFLDRNKKNFLDEFDIYTYLK